MGLALPAHETVGSASPRIVSELATRHPGPVPADPDELTAFFAFRDFAHFVEVYLSVVDLIRTPADVRLLTYEVARELNPVRLGAAVILLADTLEEALDMGDEILVMRDGAVTAQYDMTVDNPSTLDLLERMV